MAFDPSGADTPQTGVAGGSGGASDAVEPGSVAGRALLDAIAAYAVPDEIFTAVCAYLANVFEGFLPFDRVSIATLEEGAERVTLRGLWSRVPDRFIPSRYSGSLIGSSLAAVEATGEVRILDDFAEYVRTHPQSRTTAMLLREGYRSSLTCPLFCGSCGAVGFLFFTSRMAHTYRPEHAELFSRLGGEVSALLFDLTRASADVRTEAAIHALRPRLGKLVRTAQTVHQEERLLARVLELVNEGVSLQEVLDQIYETFSVLLPYDHIGFAVLSPQTRRVSVRWARSGTKRLSATGSSVPLERTSLEAVVVSGAPRILDDLDDYLERHPDSDGTRWLLSEGMRSSLTYAIGPRGRPSAFLYFSSRTPHAYEAAHVARLRQLTRPLTTVFEKALLIDELAEANARSDQLLAMLMPAQVAERLKRGETEIADQFEVTALFSDLVGFASWSADLTPAELMATLRQIFDRFDTLAIEHGVYKLRVVGDGWVALAGLPTPRGDHPEAAARLALAMMRSIDGMRAPNGRAIEMRIGLHTGPVVAGVLGGHDLHYDAWGSTLSVAARMESHAAPDRIRLSGTTAARLPACFRVEETPSTYVKSLGEVRTLWLVGEDAPTE